MRPASIAPKGAICLLSLLLVAACGGEAEGPSMQVSDPIDVPVTLDGVDVEPGNGDEDAPEGFRDWGSSTGGNDEGAADGQPTTAQDGGDGGGSKHETSGLPEDFGDPCAFNSDCSTGWCIPVKRSDADNVCTMPCIQDCPEGWGCKPVLSVGEDQIYLCAPIVETLCDECVEDADCNVGGDLCLEMPGGKFCGRFCSRNRECPEGYDCEIVRAGEEGAEEGFPQCIPVSGSCLCDAEVDYQSDPDNCGECAHRCDYENGIAACEQGECAMAECAEGFVDLNEDDSDGCEYECSTEGDHDRPDPEAKDADCDGIDGDLEWAVFVSPDGYDQGNVLGTREDPFRSVSSAIAFAADRADRDQVLVAAGTYEEQVVLQNDVSVFGGYGPSWDRDLGTHETRLTWSTPDPLGNIVAVRGSELGIGMELQGLVVESGNNTSPSGSSYALHLNEASVGVVLRALVLRSGDGGAGPDGSPGAPGGEGAGGHQGVSVNDSETLPWLIGDGDRPLGGPGGEKICEDTRTDGGRGGDGGNRDECFAGDFGDASRGGSSGCLVPSDPPGIPCSSAAGGAGGGYRKGGADGAVGKPGDPGQNGEGGATSFELDAAGLYRPSGATPGLPAGPGSGGGGGGGGGGKRDWACGAGSVKWGGSGGGGGAGGCGGKGGTGGKGGGGSFALFLVDSKPSLDGIRLEPGSGGRGGLGGAGGAGGIGHAGGRGGDGHDGSGRGGNGGAGGDGGRGGHGGGGGGGPSYGLFLDAESKPVCANLTVHFRGTGGPGGLVGDPASGETIDGGPRGADGDSAALNRELEGCEVGEE